MLKLVIILLHGQDLVNKNFKVLFSVFLLCPKGSKDKLLNEVSNK